MLIPEWLFEEPIENKPRKVYNPKLIKQIARGNFKLDDKHSKKNLLKV